MQQPGLFSMDLRKPEGAELEGMSTKETFNGSLCV